MSDWSPENYLEFRDERTQPSMDLAERIKLDSPERIIDIGCGPGNSTRILAQKWPGSAITGLDSSETMIARARKDFPEINWVCGKAEELGGDQRYTLVFSNAALQWMPDHEKLIPKLWGTVENGGVLAVQIPKFEKMDINAALKTILARKKWAKCGNAKTNMTVFNELDYYYEILSRFTKRIELWETHYYHIMDSRESILRFIESTALKPYLDELRDDEKAEFKEELLEETKNYYKPQTNGKVLFPFKRTFMIAGKK